ncbi:MAG: hypothetical protein ISS82_00810 [Nanoarchaeota archaeon]|nr:hypothetical protein [Nanoarchaeota archaeon]
MDKDELIEFFKERIEGAVSEEKNKRYRNAVELYYKAMAHIIDYLLYISPENIIVEKLKQRLEDINKLDEDIASIFREAHVLYRGTYRQSKNIMDCKKLKNDIKTIAELGKLKETLQEGIKKLS